MADANSELTLFNRRVLRWAKTFDRKYRDAALVLGWASDKHTHATLNISWPGLVRLSRKHVREGRMDKPVTERTLRRHVTEMKARGIVKIEDGKQGFADKRRGMQAANIYHVDFTKSIVAGSVADGHNFWAPLGDGYSPRVGQTETVVGQQVGQQVGPVSSPSSSSSPTTKDQNLDSAHAPITEPDREEAPIPAPQPSRGGRWPLSVPAYKPRAAADQAPSIDARRTGSAELDLIDSKFTDPVQREMASAFVVALRDYDYRLVVKAAGFWFSENSYALRRPIDKPRAYASKCAGSVRETLDGWKAQEETWRRARENDARIARLEAQEAAQRRAEASEREAAGEVRISLFDLDDPAGVPEWLPRDQAMQVPGLCGGLVWAPKPDTDSSPGISDLLDNRPARYQGCDEGEPGAGRR